MTEGGDGVSPTIAIYCCGGIKKGPADANKVSWDDSARDDLLKVLFPIEVVFLSPEERGDDISDAFTVFGRDHYQISVCDYVVADLRQRRGIGVGIELLSAKWFGKPTISVAPRQSHYRRAEVHCLGGKVVDFTHPHLFGVSDAIVDDFAEAGRWIKRDIESRNPVKGRAIVAEAIEEYKKRQFGRDEPMVEALKKLEVAREGEPSIV
ncbi:MAG: hypothetical protein ABSG55_01910 [Dehalococcoidia bacterium]